ncbi:MAG TPA: response regulator [Myxococcales bacterium LLY-WYZ-16_1]|jgi:two-component system, chemotaxis family, chemotaxis protein CheY|nr:response regulator [Myxococcales bacterium LLY-WYZ-16_1]
MQALVIDDSRAMRKILGRILTDIGYQVREAENGSAALEVLNEGATPHLALVDWNMPVMNGYEFVCKVREDARWNDLRLMMVTTETGETEVTRALDAGANEYVMKPFTKDVIVQKLKLMGL